VTFDKVGRAGEQLVVQRERGLRLPLPRQGGRQRAQRTVIVRI
jgi:hypothetical protein